MLLTGVNLGTSEPGGVVPAQLNSWGLRIVLMPLNTYPMFL